MEVVLPIEMGVCSLRTVLESEIPKVDWLQSRYDQLFKMDEKRLKALYHTLQKNVTIVTNFSDVNIFVTKKYPLVTKFIFRHYL